MKILVATSNTGKLAEIKALLAEHPELEILSLKDFPDIVLPEETGDTFEDNAVLKAEAASKLSGLPTIADDSGLCVGVLNGAPGVKSARFAGDQSTDEENLHKLLKVMGNIPEEQRDAAFLCVVAVAFPDRETRTVNGEVKGKIINAPRGTSGFGYDPVFFYPPFGKTFAEIEPSQKNKVSHRAKALKKLKILFDEGNL